MAQIMNLTQILVFCLALFSQLDIGHAVPSLEERAVTCANIPGVTTPKSSGSSIARRQTSASMVSLKELIAQDSPCIPNTVDTSPINTSMVRAQSTGRVSAQGLGHFFSSVWKTVTDVFKVVKDIQAIITYGNLVDILKLVVDGWQLITDIGKTLLVLTNPSGGGTITVRPTPVGTTTTMLPTPTSRPKQPIEEHCGWGTGKMCR